MEQNRNLILPGILEYCIKNNASDIHLSEGEKMYFRINKKLLGGGDIIDNNKIKGILLELTNNNQIKAKKFLEDKDMDFTYIYKNGISFRVNAFLKGGKISFVLRYINPKAYSIEELGIPSGISNILKARQGLVLITGTSGSGKSTSVVSILNEINNIRNNHIITIEDPIEFRFKNNKSIFSQREVGKDTKDFDTALTYISKEDPDIIMISEIKDSNTMNKAIELASVGNLVIATLNAGSATGVISKVLDYFPPELQSNILTKLGDNLVGIMNQKLVIKADQKGLIGIFELLLFNMGIRNLVKSGNLSQLRSQIETGEKSGMIIMKKYAKKLENEGIIKEEDYIDLLESED